MELVCEKVVKFDVDYFDFQNFIENKFGHYIEFMAEYEWNYNCYYDFDAVKKPLNELQQKQLDLFIESGRLGLCSIEILLTDLCNKDILEEGTYSIYTDH